MSPSTIPRECDHLDAHDHKLVEELHHHLEAGRHREAQDAAEELWWGAVDAHKRLWHGVSNALTAVCSRELGHLKGAREIALRAHEILAPYPGK